MLLNNKVMLCGGLLTYKWKWHSHKKAAIKNLLILEIVIDDFQTYSYANDYIIMITLYFYLHLLLFHFPFAQS